MENIIYFSNKANAKRALKKIGELALAAAEGLLVREVVEGEETGRFGFTDEAANAVQNPQPEAKSSGFGGLVNQVLGKQENACTASKGMLHCNPDHDGQPNHGAKKMENQNDALTPEQIAADKAADKEAKKLADKAAKDEKRAATKAEKEAKALAAKADKEAKKLAYLQPVQNGVRRPIPETNCGKAWAEYDRVSAALGRPAQTKDCTCPEGLNKNTFLSEHHPWRKFHGVEAARKQAEPASTTATE